MMQAENYPCFLASKETKKIETAEQPAEADGAKAARFRRSEAA